MTNKIKNSNKLVDKIEDIKSSVVENAEDFYQELDEKRSHQSCCTCQTMAIFFFIILILAGSGVYYFYRRIGSGELFQGSVIGTSSIDNVQDKLKSIKNPIGNELHFSLTDEELSAVFDQGISFQNFVLKDITTSINPGNVLIYGNLIKPLSSRVVMTTVPQISAGKIEFKVTSVTFGSVNLPPYFNNGFTNSLTSNFNNKVSMIYQNYQIDQVTLNQNQMFISGKIK